MDFKRSPKSNAFHSLQAKNVKDLCMRSKLKEGNSSLVLMIEIAYVVLRT